MARTTDAETSQRQIFDIRQSQISRDDIETEIRRSTLETGWSMSTHSPVLITRRISRYSAITQFNLDAEHSKRLIADTRFLDFCDRKDRKIEIGILVVLCTMVFFLPGWFLGPIMLAAIFVVLAPVVYRVSDVSTNGTV